MTPSWYDVLGVEQDATAEEVRAAWKESVDGLDPTDRRFKQRNRAAEVLLDPVRRAAHDDDLARDDEVDETDDDGAGDLGGADAPDADARVTLDKAGRGTSSERTWASTSSPAPSDDPAVRESGPRGVPVLLAVALGVLAVLLVAASVVSLARGDDSGPDDASSEVGLPDSRDIQAARAAAETAIVPVLSYDYRTLEASKQAALPYLTSEYAEQFQQLYTVVEENATNARTIVTADVLSSGIVRTGENRVDVLVLVDRPTRNATRDVTSEDQVTVRMLDVDGSWLVDCLITMPGGTCEA